MNIHDAQRYGPRKVGYKPNNTAKPPRQRDNLKGSGCGKAGRLGAILIQQKQFAGGKHLRRAKARHSISVRFYDGLDGRKRPAFTLSGTMNY
jgi:hypothetical protein